MPWRRLSLSRAEAGNHLPCRRGRDKRVLRVDHPDAGAERPERRFENGKMEMLSNSHHYVRPSNEAEQAYLESLIREDFERCHPGETLDDIKRRASFSKEDKGLLRDWMAVAASRSAADAAKIPPAFAA